MIAWFITVPTLLVISIPGVLEDIATWESWLSWVDSNTWRWILVVAVLSFLLTVNIDSMWARIRRKQAVESAGPPAAPPLPASERRLSPPPNFDLEREVSGEWVHLIVRNDGPTRCFRVKVERIQGTKEPQHRPWSLKWRTSDDEDRKVVDKEALNFARIYAPGQRSSEPDGAFRLYSHSKQDGWVVHPLKDELIITVRVIALDPKQQIERTVRLRFDEVRIDTGQQGQVEGDQMVSDREQRELIGTRTYREARWKGWRLPNGYVEAEGPFCPADDTLLKFKSASAHPSPVEDYQEIRPPDTRLVCEQCGRSFYLDATDRKSARVGDARSYAAWRLGGGRTRLEALADRLGL